MTDTLGTASALGVRLTSTADGATVRADTDPCRTSPPERLRADWPPPSAALNALARAMGQPDLYPFLLPAPVVDKLRFVLGVMRDAAQRQ